jgi:integrase
MFNWGIGRDILEANPCAQVKHPGHEQQRQRVLTEAEIRSVWLAFEQLGPLLGSMFQLRLLTAQRGAEVQSMRWKDIDLSSGWWTIPPTVAKNKLAHRVPLSAPVHDILHRLQVGAGDSEWVFPSPTRMGRHVVSIQKTARDVRSNSEVDFVPHDLRRTAASMMTGMGIQRLVVGKILNHVESGATRTYDRHSYDGEKRQALEAWAQRLRGIIAGRKAKVVRLPDRV